MPRGGSRPFLSMTVIVAALITLCVIAVLIVVVYRRGRRERGAPEDAPDASPRAKFDTTLGEFHDMREALRPLHHSRAASRRDPREPERP